MPKIALKLKPLEGYFEERPADGDFDPSLDWTKLKPIDLDWREAWIEAFLARHKSAIPACLGDANKSQAVYRQLADMDLVFEDSTSRVVTLVELKKQGGEHPTAALCQLARNLDKARRVIREMRPNYSVRAVVGGTWREGQLDRARKTRAWEVLKTEHTIPTFVVYSGAISPDGSEYFVLNEGKSPFPNKGKTVGNLRFEQLKRLTRQTSERLPPGLDIVAYRIGERAVIRFTADSKLRSSYLQSEDGSPFLGPLAAFFRVRTALDPRPDVITQFRIAQRLELFVQPRLADISAEYSVLGLVLAEIEEFATDTDGS